jgi:uncharacterized membrane protein
MTPEMLREASDQVVPLSREAGNPRPVDKSNFVFLAVVCLVLVAGFWLRWSGLNQQSLWADEGYTTWFSQFSPGEQWHLMPWETQAPIYHIALHYWTRVWGTSEASFRGLSALFSSLSLVVLCLIARKMWPSRVFLIISLALCSISFFQIWYAKEARSYALLSFFLVTSIYCLQLYLEKPTVARLLVVVGAVSASLYTHNMALYYIPGLVIFWFTYPSEMTIRQRGRNALIAGAAVILIYVPWLPLLIDQARSVHGYFWAPKPSIRDLCDSLFTFNGLDVWVLMKLQNYVRIPRLFGFGFWVILLSAILVSCVVGAWSGSSSTDRRKCIALQLYALLPVFLIFAWSRLSTSVYVNRNLIGASALLPLVICAPIAVHAGRRKRMFESVACLVLLGAIISLGMHRESKDNWRGVTEYLLKNPERQRLVLAFQPYCQILVHYYATGLFKSYPQPDFGGLITQFDVAPRGPGILPNLRTADLNAILVPAIKSGRYKEIDIALQMERLPANVQAIPAYLKENCASVENVEFDKIGVSRCVLKGE